MELVAYRFADVSRSDGRFLCASVISGEVTDLIRSFILSDPPVILCASINHDDFVADTQVKWWRQSIALSTLFTVLDGSQNLQLKLPHQKAHYSIK